MAVITWDAPKDRQYEAGTEKGVVFPHIGSTPYKGYAWNGLIKVSEDPEGGEPKKMKADNIVYAQILGSDSYKSTADCYTYPSALEPCFGNKVVAKGVTIGQQTKAPYDFSYVTKIGNAADGWSGYKLHLVWGCTANPVKKEYNTISEDTEGMTMSVEMTSTPVPVTGSNPTSVLVLNSTEVAQAAMKKVEDLIYGTTTLEGKMPTPDEVLQAISGVDS